MRTSLYTMTVLVAVLCIIYTPVTSAGIPPGQLPGRKLSASKSESSSSSSSSNKSAPESAAPATDKNTTTRVKKPPPRVRAKNGMDFVTLAYNSALQYSSFSTSVAQFCDRVNEHVGIIQVPDGDGGVLYEIDWRVTPETFESVGKWARATWRLVTGQTATSLYSMIVNSYESNQAAEMAAAAAAAATTSGQDGNGAPVPPSSPGATENTNTPVPNRPFPRVDPRDIKEAHEIMKAHAREIDDALAALNSANGDEIPDPLIHPRRPVAPPMVDTNVDND